MEILARLFSLASTFFLVVSIIGMIKPEIINKKIQTQPPLAKKEIVFFGLLLSFLCFIASGFQKDGLFKTFLFLLVISSLILTLGGTVHPQLFTRFTKSKQVPSRVNIFFKGAVAFFLSMIIFGMVSENKTQYEETSLTLDTTSDTNLESENSFIQEEQEEEAKETEEETEEEKESFITHGTFEGIEIVAEGEPAKKVKTSFLTFSITSTIDTKAYIKVNQKREIVMLPRKNKTIKIPLQYGDNQIEFAIKIEGSEKEGKIQFQFHRMTPKEINEELAEKCRKNPLEYLEIKKHSWRTGKRGFFSTFTPIHTVLVYNPCPIRFKDITFEIEYFTKTNTPLIYSNIETIYEYIPPKRYKWLRFKGYFNVGSKAQKASIKITDVEVAD